MAPLTLTLRLAPTRCSLRSYRHLSSSFSFSVAGRAQTASPRWRTPLTDREPLSSSNGLGGKKGTVSANRRLSTCSKLSASEASTLPPHPAPKQKPSEDSTPTTLKSDTSTQPLGRIEPRLSITFTCTVPDCGTRSGPHEFSKDAYTKGVVLIQCPECKSRHLIADHLNWFSDLGKGGEPRTIEDIMREKGESDKVKKGVDWGNGVIEVDPEPKE